MAEGKRGGGLSKDWLRNRLDRLRLRTRRSRLRENWLWPASFVDADGASAGSAAVAECLALFSEASAKSTTTTSASLAKDETIRRRHHRAAVAAEATRLFH